MEKTKKWYVLLAVSVLIMLSAATMFMVAVKLLGFENLDINDMMVSFVGIIATFIVIGNYAQVQDIKKDVDGKLKEFEERQQRIESVIKNIAIEKKILRASGHCDCANERESTNLAVHLIQNKNGIFSLVTADTDSVPGRLISAKWRWKNDRAEFYESSEPSKTIEHIMMVDEYEYNEDCVNKKIKQYLS